MKAQKLFNRFILFVLSVIIVGLIIPFNLNPRMSVVGATENQMPLPHMRNQATQPIIIDHTTTDITAIPQVWIEQAKATFYFYNEAVDVSSLMIDSDSGQARQ